MRWILMVALLAGCTSPGTADLPTPPTGAPPPTLLVGDDLTELHWNAGDWDGPMLLRVGLEPHEPTTCAVNLDYSGMMSGSNATPAWSQVQNMRFISMGEKQEEVSVRVARSWPADAGIVAQGSEVPLTPEEPAYPSSMLSGAELNWTSYALTVMIREVDPDDPLTLDIACRRPVRLAAFSVSTMVRTVSHDELGGTGLHAQHRAAAGGAFAVEGGSWQARVGVSGDDSLLVCTAPNVSGDLRVTGPGVDDSVQLGIEPAMSFVWPGQGGDYALYADIRMTPALGYLQVPPSSYFGCTVGAWSPMEAVPDPADAYRLATAAAAGATAARPVPGP